MEGVLHGRIGKSNLRLFIGQCFLETDSMHGRNGRHKKPFLSPASPLNSSPLCASALRAIRDSLSWLGVQRCKAAERLPGGDQNQREDGRKGGERHSARAERHSRAEEPPLNFHTLCLENSALSSVVLKISVDVRKEGLSFEKLSVFVFYMPKGKLRSSMLCHEASLIFCSVCKIMGCRYLQYYNSNTLETEVELHRTFQCKIVFFLQTVDLKTLIS